LWSYLFGFVTFEIKLSMSTAADVEEAANGCVDALSTPVAAGWGIFDIGITSVFIIVLVVYVSVHSAMTSDSATNSQKSNGIFGTRSPIMTPITFSPTEMPVTASPTLLDTVTPTRNPSQTPTRNPTLLPGITGKPTFAPSYPATSKPTIMPSTPKPTVMPSISQAPTLRADDFESVASWTYYMGSGTYFALGHQGDDFAQQ
jgi:hypothetical protein